MPALVLAKVATHFGRVAEVGVRACQQREHAHHAGAVLEAVIGSHHAGAVLEAVIRFRAAARGDRAVGAVADGSALQRCKRRRREDVEGCGGAPRAAVPVRRVSQLEGLALWVEGEAELAERGDGRLAAALVDGRAARGDRRWARRWHRRRGGCRRHGGRLRGGGRAVLWTGVGALDHRQARARDGAVDAAQLREAHLARGLALEAGGAVGLVHAEASLQPHHLSLA